LIPQWKAVRAAYWRGDGLWSPLPSAHRHESGIFASLPPGHFTVILEGKNGGTGIALVEIYNLK
jgi:hypothetical protein